MVFVETVVVRCYAKNSPENIHPTLNGHTCCQEGWQDMGC